MTIELKPEKIYKLPIKNGFLDIRVSVDPDYPGIDIEYISRKEKNTHANATRPRVLVECTEENKLRTIVWANPHSEDYSDEIEFTCVDD